MPAPDPHRPVRPPIQRADRGQWRKHIEPRIAKLADCAGNNLHRHRARIGPWVVELVSDDDRTSQLFASHRRPHVSSNTPDAYVYALANDARCDGRPQVRDGSVRSDSPECWLCAENRRAAVLGTSAYARVDEVCRQLLQSLSISTRVAAAPSTQNGGIGCVPASGACVEYQPHDGATRTALLLGLPDDDTALHALSLASCKPANALVANGLVCFDGNSGRVSNAEQRLWLPTRVAGYLRHVAPLLAMSPNEGVELDPTLRRELAKYRDAADLVRAFESGQFSESLLRHLTVRLAHAAEGFSLVDPRALVGADRFLDAGSVSDCIAVTHDPNSDVLLRDVPAAEFVACCRAQWENPAAPSEELADVLSDCINRLHSTSRLGTATLNARLQPAPMQFCLRHYLEGLSDSIRILPADRPANDSIRARMSAENWKSLQRTRRGALVGFYKRNVLVEAVAFDVAEEGFSQVKAAWPKQVADFFGRHAPLQARDLFAALHNSPPRTDVNLSQAIHFTT